MLKRAPSDVNVSQTDDTQITFEINYLPKLNISWFFNENPIQDSTKYRMETKVQIILNVNKTDFGDSGTYTAVIENGIEKLVAPIKMNVQGKMKRLCLIYHIYIYTSNARLRTRSALSRRNHVSKLSANYLFKADAIHVSLSRIQTLYTIKQVTLVSAARLTFD